MSATVVIQWVCLPTDSMGMLGGDLSPKCSADRLLNILGQATNKYGGAFTTKKVKVR